MTKTSFQVMHSRLPVYGQTQVAKTYVFSNINSKMSDAGEMQSLGNCGDCGSYHDSGYDRYNKTSCGNAEHDSSHNNTDNIHRNDLCSESVEDSSCHEGTLSRLDNSGVRMSGHSNPDKSAKNDTITTSPIFHCRRTRILQRGGPDTLSLQTEPTDQSVHKRDHVEGADNNEDAPNGSDPTVNRKCKKKENSLLPKKKWTAQELQAFDYEAPASDTKIYHIAMYINTEDKKHFSNIPAVPVPLKVLCGQATFTMLIEIGKKHGIACMQRDLKLAEVVALLSAHECKTCSEFLTVFEPNKEQLTEAQQAKIYRLKHADVLKQKECARF